ncbi:MAG: glycosyl hydrolase family 28-related protein [Rhodopila sp.]|nr:glycosyl hydrolase family 28-related protein [Rhodopila sp.]
MPTIDQLAPATSASDSDEFIVSQAGITRKITRTQVLNGVQPQLTVPAGTLLGGTGTGIGTPQVITVGQNLSFNGSTLSATATPFVVQALPSGTVPVSGDLIPVSQAGKNVAVTYGQLMNGMSGVANIDLSQGLVTPTGATSGQTLSQLTANMLPLSGGTLTGSLSLSGTPTASAQATNKAYVDQQLSTALPLSGGSMSGVLTLAAAPQHPLDSATKAYADSIGASMLPIVGGSLSGSLLLNADPTNILHASTKRYADLKVSRTGDTLSGVLALAADPVSALQAATKNYVDTQVSATLPKSGGTLLGGLFLASDPTSNAQAATKQYVDQRVLRTGDTLSGALILAADPVLAGQAATKNYVDSQVAGSISRSGASMTGALALAADPAVPLQASTKQYVDLRVARIGDTLTGALYLAADPTAPLQAATKQYIDNQFATAITKAGATFTGPVVLAGDPVVPAQAATKQYTDTRVSRSGDTLSGALILASDPTVSAQAATKNYVDAQVLTALPRTGGSLSGSLVLSSDPTSTGQAATKRYVDTQVGTALPITGGSLTGLLSLAAVPTTAQHAATKQYVDGQVATALSQSGGTLTGPLTLAGLPTTPLQAATKSYVDANPNSAGVINVAMPPYGAKLDGVTDDTAAFKAAYQAAGTGAVIYVPHGTTVLQQPGTWGIALTKRVKWVVDGTQLPDGTPLAAAIPTGGGPVAFVLPGFVVGNTSSGLTTSQGASQTTDFALTQSSYIVNHSGGSAGTVISNVRADTIIYSSPGNYVWGGLDRLIWAGTQTPTAATAAQHVGRYIQTLRQATTLGSNGQFLPQPQLWAGCLEYRDTTGRPSSATNASLTVEMDWFGNGLDDANSRTVQSIVIGQHNTSGPAVEVSTIIGVYLAAGSSGSAKTVFGVGVPFSTAIIDTSYARQINNAPVLKMSAGQAIAFESTNSNRLAYDSSTNTLWWNQGTLPYPVGKGISVGWGEVYSSSVTLPNYTSGHIIFLVGTSSFSITLPPANTVAVGTGYTFSVLGTCTVRIVPSGSDGIESGTVVLHANDRYHIVSDSGSFWHEVFWTNAVSPRFLGPVVLPSYAVATLPTGMTAGAKAFASNGRKPGEGAGGGTGVEVFFDGQRWISSCSGTAVAA